jgi:hypothetical protein
MRHAPRAAAAGRALLLAPSLLVLVWIAGPGISAAEIAPAPGATVELFEDDPTLDPAVAVDGTALLRLQWQADAPAFPGDRPGSLVATYDATLDPGRIGWPLPAALGADDPFIAAAVFAIDPQGFHADPFGFFQISWGLWNSATTGEERTGTLQSFAGDTFELIEFDYFPNVSPFFGGPFLSPTVFGVANEADPAFPFLGSFVNTGFGSTQAELPLGEPLLALLEHRPADDALVVSVHRIAASGGLLPVPGAVTVVPLSGLAVREYTVDTVGLTLWRDGFSGPDPSLFARVAYHAIVVRGGEVVSPGEVLDALGLGD